MSEFSPAAKNQFNLAAETFGLDEKTRDRAWARMQALGLPPSDPTNVYIAVAGLLEAAAVTIPRAIDAFPSRIEEASQRAVKSVSDAAVKKVQAANTDLLSTVGKSIETNVNRVMASVVKGAETKVGTRLLTGTAVVALCAFLGGYVAATGHVKSLAAEYSAFVARPDAGTWLALAEVNPDLNASYAQFCAPGSKYLGTSNGARVCQLPLFLDKPSTAALTGGGLNLTNFLGAYSPIWLVSGGLLVGLLIRKLLKSFMNFGPIRWLVD